MSNPFGILALIFFLAFLVESLVEYLFGQAFSHIPSLSQYSWTLMYIAAAVGVLSAFIYSFDLISTLGAYIGMPIQVNWMGISLTGLAIGRGSNFIHDLVTRFFIKSDVG